MPSGLHRVIAQKQREAPKRSIVADLAAARVIAAAGLANRAH